MKKAYLVAVPTVTNPDMFAKEYASKVADTLKPVSYTHLTLPTTGSV